MTDDRLFSKEENRDNFLRNVLSSKKPTILFSIQLWNLYEKVLANVFFSVSPVFKKQGHGPEETTNKRDSGDSENLYYAFIAD